MEAVDLLRFDLGLDRSASASGTMSMMARLVT
jgi:hypothetical protein